MPVLLLDVQVYVGQTVFSFKSPRTKRSSTLATPSALEHSLNKKY